MSEVWSVFGSASRGWINNDYYYYYYYLVSPISKSVVGKFKATLKSGYWIEGEGSRRRRVSWKFCKINYWD